MAGLSGRFVCMYKLTPTNERPMSHIKCDNVSQRIHPESLSITMLFLSVCMSPAGDTDKNLDLWEAVTLLISNITIHMSNPFSSSVMAHS